MCQDSIHILEYCKRFEEGLRSFYLSILHHHPVTGAATVCQNEQIYDLLSHMWSGDSRSVNLGQDLERRKTN